MFTKQISANELCSLQCLYCHSQLLHTQHTSGGLNQDFAVGSKSGHCKNHVRVGSSHSAARNINVAKFN